jgi:RNA polymerase sigma-70 factor (ECF subfamily)
MPDLDHFVSAIAAGDAMAFGQWVAGAELPLRASLHKFAAVVDVEAVLQETLLRTWQVAPRFRSDGKANGFLRLATSIARHLAIDLARRHRAEWTAPREEVEMSAVAEAASPADPFLRRALAECQERLPDQPRKALAQRLAAAGADSDVVLAERVKMRLNTFLQNVTRARRLLADCLRKRGVDLSIEIA